MASKVLTLSVVLRAVNLLSGPVRNAVRVLEDVEKVTSRTKGLKQMAQDLDAVGGALQKIGAVTLGVGLGGAFALGITQLPGDAVRAEHSLRAIGNTAELTREQIAAAGPELRDLTRQTNQYQAALLEGLGTLAAAGLDFRVALAALRPIGRVATGEVANLNDVASTSFAVIDNLKIPVGELGYALDVLAQSGKEGRFELADMARYFPVITAAAQQLNMKGVPAVASLGAALQVAMKGAGDPSQAATNFQNFLSKLTAPETVKNFKALGIDLQREFAKATAEGKDPILEFLRLIDRISGGDPFKMGELFGDQQVLSFIRPLLANLEEYERIRASALGARGVVDQDYLNMLTTSSELWKALKINVAAVFGPTVQTSLRFVASILATINASPGLQKFVVGGVVLATVLGALTLVLGTFVVFAGAALTATGTLLNGAAALRAGWIGTTATLEGGMLVMGRLGQWLRATTTAVRAFSLALFSSPITWVVAGVLALAAAVYLVYRNWERITGFLEGQGWFRAGANILSQVVDGMRSMASRPVELMRAVAQRIRNFLPFSPAKEGPLRDLHRIRLVETIAETIRPGPLLGAMRATALAAAVPLALVQPPPLPGAGPRAAAGGGAPAVQFHYAPTYQIGAGAGPGVVDALRQHDAVQRDELRRQVERMVDEIWQSRERRTLRRGNG